MKMTRKILVAAAALLAVVGLIGCSALSDDGGSSNNYFPIIGANGSTNLIGGTGSTGKLVTTKGVIKNFSDFDVLPGNSARTILPEVDGATYDYYVYGKTIDGSTEYPPVVAPATAAPEAITLTPGAGPTDPPTFEITALAARWEFTVYALVQGTTAPTSPADAKEKASLIGYSYADLTSAAATVDFTLKSDGLTGPGDVTLTIDLSDDYGTSHWNTELPTGAKVYGSIENFVTGAVVAAETEITVLDGSAVGFKESDVAPGTYNFVVRIKDATNNVIGDWSDILIVLPTRDTEATVYIPRVIGVPPVDVDFLTAVYIKESMDLPDHQGYYMVQFTWDDTPKTETHYELQVADITKLGKKNSDYDWDTGATTNGSVIDYTPGATLATIDATEAALANRTSKQLLSSDEYHVGSVNRNNTNVVFFLKLGSEYTARIRAVNSQGTSQNWTKLDLTDCSVAADITTATSTTGTPPIADGVVGTVAPFVNEKKYNEPTDVTKYVYPATAVTQIASYTNTYPDDSELANNINRYRITYHLNAGQYRKDNGSGSTTLMQSDVVEYHTLDAAGEGYPLWNGTGDPDAGVTTPVNLHFYSVGEGLTREFKAWVLPSYYASATAASDPNNTVYTRMTTATPPALKGDNPNYTGTANYDVYAIYDGVTNTLTGKVIPAVDYAKYTFEASWITWTGTALTSQAGVSVASGTFSKAAADTRLSGAHFQVTIPNAAGLPAMYDDITMEIVSKSPYSRKLIVKTDGAIAAGTTKNITDPAAKPDLSGWNTGFYEIIFTARKANTPNDLIRTVRYTFELTD